MQTVGQHVLFNLDLQVFASSVATHTKLTSHDFRLSNVFDPRYDMLSFMMKSLRIYFAHCVLFSAGRTSVSTLAEATNKRLLYAGNATAIFPQFQHNFGIEGNSHSLLAFVGISRM